MAGVNRKPILIEVPGKITNHLKPQELLKDGIHPNDHGGYLIAELLRRQLGTWGPGIMRGMFQKRPLIEEWKARVCNAADSELSL